ncbi:hypothetical protein [Parvimonas micra]|uniref:hypothetical protein n=1 Tax=Parvimonas micra TaxID=33033 RepID=UPI00241F1D46|nr:hypothetical protein [Parvimonas micra]
MLKQDFINKVKEGNKYEVRSFLSNYLVRNRDDFKEALKYAKSNMTNLMEKYNNDNGEPFENNPENWTEFYFDAQRVYLKSNFCDERIEHLLKVSAKLFPENIFSKTSTTSSSTSYSSRSTSRKTTSRKKSDDDIVPKIAIGTGAVIAGVGLLTLKVSLIAVGAVVAVGGAVYKYNKDN